MTYLRPALVMLILLTLITGIAYPLLTTGLAQLLFPGAPTVRCCSGATRRSAPR